MCSLRSLDLITEVFEMPEYVLEGDLSVCLTILSLGVLRVLFC